MLGFVPFLPTTQQACGHHSLQCHLGRTEPSLWLAVPLAAQVFLNPKPETLNPIPYTLYTLNPQP